MARKLPPDNSMRIVALVKGLDNVCCRYRVAALRPHLERAGHSLNILPWPASLLSRMLLGRGLLGAEVLILQRRMPPVWQLRLFRSLARFVIFDFDDAVFLRDSFSPQGPHCARRAARFRGVVRAADAVVAGNSFLRAQASLWAEPERLHMVPTCLELDRYPVRNIVEEANLPHLVWIGSASTLRILRQFRPLLEEVGARVRGLQFKVICDEFPQVSNMQVLACPWSENREAAELAEARIGFSWLPDDLWSQGKCGLKVLQYMAAGLPVIANPVGLHRQLVVPGRTGFLVNNAEQCAAAVRTLAEDPTLRRRMGHHGRELVRTQFHVAQAGARWVELLHNLAEGARRLIPVQRSEEVGEGAAQRADDRP